MRPFKDKMTTTTVKRIVMMDFTVKSLVRRSVSAFMIFSSLNKIRTGFSTGNDGAVWLLRFLFTLRRRNTVLLFKGSAEIQGVVIADCQGKLCYGFVVAVDNDCLGMGKTLG